MTEQYFLALDLGTSSLKCAVVSHKGRVLGVARTPISYVHPPGLSELALEFDAGEVWAQACGLVGECLERSELTGLDISAVGITSQRGGMVLLDRRGKEVYAGPNADIRAFFEGMEIDDSHGKELYGVTGHLPSFLFAPARLKWFQSNQPQVFEEVSSTLPLCDWLTFRMTGEIRGERSALVELGLLPFLDTVDEGSIPELLDLDPGLLPKVTVAGELLGGVTNRASDETGLRAGTPVVSGGPDTQCGLLGLGAVDQGQLGILMGWSGPLQLVTNSPCLDEEQRTWTGRHVLGDRWMLESNTTEAGHSLDWVTATLGIDREGIGLGPTSELEEASTQNAYQAIAMLGPRIMDAKRLGIQMGGFLFPVPVGHTRVSRKSLVTAALKNLAFAIKGNAIQLAEISGLRPSDTFLGGGLTNIEGFPKLVADALGQLITVPETRDSSLLGAAMCAGVGGGAYNSLAEASAAMKGDSLSLEPDTGKSSILEEEYERWLVLYNQLSALAEDL